MIFVSSSCVKHSKIADSVRHLADEGYSHIELSGGTKYYEGYEKDLLALKSEYDLSYLVHNYFPPPETPFVINLASTDMEIAALSYKNIQRALQLTDKFGAGKCSFHAGFLINIPLSQIGQSIEKNQLFDRKDAMRAFTEQVKRLQKGFPHIDLYIENNVLSGTNYSNFSGINPFFLCDSAGYKELEREMDFNLLLDVAHLKVSSRTLNRNFESELDLLLPKAGYIHISDNDGTADTNGRFSVSSGLFRLMKKYKFTDKVITLEVYEGMDALKESYEAAQKLLL